MRFNRKMLKVWVEMHLASQDADNRCIGQNFLIEENVSEERRLELESHNPDCTDVEKLFSNYYIDYVQGKVRGHIPSTFVMSKNRPALQHVSVNPARKLMRLECLDELLLQSRGEVDYDEFIQALNSGDSNLILRILRRFHGFPGERPVFSGYKSDIRGHLRKKTGCLASSIISVCITTTRSTRRNRTASRYSNTPPPRWSSRQNGKASEIVSHCPQFLNPRTTPPFVPSHA